MIGSKCKMCRREASKLFLKGSRCSSEKCAFNKRQYPPGEHGQRRRQKASNYALQLREKQKVKRMYGVLERQFRKYFHIAANSKGVTGRTLLQILERRLDNVVFRLCLAQSRAQARQIVNHGHVSVNNRRVNIPSFLVKPEDVIEIRLKGDRRQIIKDNIQMSTQERSVAGWLKADHEQLKAEVIRMPEKEDIRLPIQEQLIVELYSK